MTLPGRHLFVSIGLVLLTACGPGADQEFEEHVDDVNLDPSEELAEPLVSGKFRYVQLDVGQGDATLVISPSGCAALFDAGPPGSAITIQRYLQSLGIKRLEFAVISHLHSDHLGSLADLESGTTAISVPVVYDHGGKYQSPSYSRYASHFASRRRTVTLGQTLSLCGEVAVNVLAVGGNGLLVDDENTKSVVAKVSYQGFDALVGGDATGAEGEDLEAKIAGQVGQVELYKVHHHGSRYSSNDKFLGAIDARLAFISLAHDNGYGHPHKETVARLNAHKVEIFQTQDPVAHVRRGHIVVDVDNGTTFSITQKGVTQKYGTTLATGRAVINEVLANEVGSDVKTEFIELLNVGPGTLDLSGHSLSDTTGVRHTFAAGTRLGVKQSIVIYGGATGIPDGATGAVAASTGGLGLNNDGDTVVLRTAAGNELTRAAFTGALADEDGVSLTRATDGELTAAYVAHNSISTLPSSAGRRASGAAF